MQVFATNYPESMSGDIVNESDWSWKPVNDRKGTGPGKPTKTMCCMGSGSTHFWVEDNDSSPESPSGSMLVA